MSFENLKRFVSFCISLGIKSSTVNLLKSIKIKALLKTDENMICLNFMVKYGYEAEEENGRS